MSFLGSARSLWTSSLPRPWMIKRDQGLYEPGETLAHAVGAFICPRLDVPAPTPTGAIACTSQR